MRVFVAGATGYIGRATVEELVSRGHEVVAFARPRPGREAAILQADLSGAELRFGDVTDPESLAEDGFRSERFDAVVSCLASRNGHPADARKVDLEAQLHLLDAARGADVQRFVLLSAICVQKPALVFQHAKLAFETTLAASGVPFVVVRATAFFKSLAGQIERVRRGRPFLVFGDGEWPRCKPISARDLATFLADRLVDPEALGKTLPIGGPQLVSPREQAALLGHALGVPVRVRSVPRWVFSPVIGVLDGLSPLVPKCRDWAEFARIGRYYATESMLVWDPFDERYRPEATPSFGSDTLGAFYAEAATHGASDHELGEHRLFERSERPRR